MQSVVNFYDKFSVKRITFEKIATIFCTRNCVIKQLLSKIIDTCTPWKIATYQCQLARFEHAYGLNI